MKVDLAAIEHRLQGSDVCCVQNDEDDHYERLSSRAADDLAALLAYAKTHQDILV